MKLATALAALTLTTSALALTAPSPKLIERLNVASRNFRSAQANVNYDNYTYVVRAHDTQTGNLFIERHGNTATMGTVISDAGWTAPAKIISFNGGVLELYTPGTDTVDVLKAGSNQAKYQSFLTLGFGGSGTDLERAWNINDLGTETVNGVSCEKLDLIPKDHSIANTFTHVMIWIDPTRDVSMKQIFYAPNKDSRTTVYSNIKLNDPINKKPYSIPSRAHRINH